MSVNTSYRAAPHNNWVNYSAVRIDTNVQQFRIGPVALIELGPKRCDRHYSMISADFSSLVAKGAEDWNWAISSHRSFADPHRD